MGARIVPPAWPFRRRRGRRRRRPYKRISALPDPSGGLNRCRGGWLGVGWPTPPAGLIDPVLQYDHHEGEAGIGGFVYRGSKIPALKGKYIFGDLGKELDENIPSGQLFADDLATGQITRIGTNLGNPFPFFLKGIAQQQRRVVPARQLLDRPVDRRADLRHQRQRRWWRRRRQHPAAGADLRCNAASMTTPAFSRECRPA